MEFLVPGFLLLLFAVLIVFIIIPRLGPVVTLIGAGLLLTAGMFHHYKLFRNEYARATWADKLKAYGPGILYTIMTLFIIGFIFSLWGGGSVPVPESPSPSPNTETPTPSNSPLSAITNTVSAVTNTAANAFKDTVNMGRNLVRNIGQGVGNMGQRAAAAIPFVGAQPQAQAQAQAQPAAPFFGGPPSRPPNSRNGRNVSFFSEY
jgi:hypothetical protein